MTSEEYGQYIDDFELGADVMPGESLTEYIERRRREFESKADGGVIGIEVKIADEMAKGGRVGLFSGGALKGLASLFKGGDKAADLAKQEEIFRSGDITTDFLEKVDDKVIKKFITTRDTGGPGGYGMYDSFDDMPNGLKAAELISRIRKPGGGIDYEAAELFIGKKLKGDETVDELIKMVIKKPGLTDSPLKDFENYVLKGDGAKDGGRVGLFMGGPPLEGQALSIYESMNAYGFTDQQIADSLSARGLYTPPGSGTTEPEQVTGIINQQINQGGDDRITELQKTFTEGAKLKSVPAISDISAQNLSTYLKDPALQAKYGSSVEYDKFMQSQMPQPNLIEKGITATKDFFSKFNQPKVRGTLGTRLANQPRLPLPGAIASFALSPFNPDSKNYNPDLIEQLNFLELGENMIGRNPNSGLLQYGSGSVLRGQNVISGFGSNNYLAQLNKYINRKNITDKARQRGIDERNKFLAEQKAKQEAAFQNQLNQRQRDQRQRDLSTIEQAYRDFAAGRDDSYSSGRAGEQADGSYNDPFDPGGGEKDGGLIGYNKGGLATMFTRRR